MLSNVSELHSELREAISLNGIPTTDCPLFNSMGLTICSDVHRDALVHLCRTNTLIVCPVAVIVLRRFKKQMTILLQGGTLPKATPSRSDLVWEQKTRRRIASMDLSHVPNDIVLMSIHDMLQSDVHTCAMFEVCRRFRIVRPFVEQRLSEYANHSTSHGHVLGR